MPYLVAMKFSNFRRESLELFVAVQFGLLVSSIPQDNVSTLGGSNVQSKGGGARSPEHGLWLEACSHFGKSCSRLGSGVAHESSKLCCFRLLRTCMSFVAAMRQAIEDSGSFGAAS